MFREVSQRVKCWLARHRRLHLHFLLTGFRLVNQVEQKPSHDPSSYEKTVYGIKMMSRSLGLL
jgi:hypothetical protein